MNIRRRDLLHGLAALWQPAKDRIHAFGSGPAALVTCNQYFAPALICRRNSVR